MAEWKPEGPLKHYDGVTIQYLRAGGHGHTGAHALTLSNGDTLVVYPTSTTTTRGRSRVILDAIGAVYGSSLNATAYLVGALVLYGANDLELNGDALGPEGGHGEWGVTLRDDGTLNATYTGPR